MNKVVWSGIALAVLATSSLAIAAQTMTPPPPDVPFAEIKADADKLWDRLDANHDGRIDETDRDARVLERFAQWDTNHDGMVSKDEFLAHIHAREAEHKAHDHRGPPPPGGPGDDMGPGHGPMGDMGPHHGGHMMGMMIIGPAMHEARKDGAITRAAFDAAIKARFDQIDTNHDGKLSRDEMRAARPHGDWGRGHGHGRGDMPPPPAGQ